jgi:hypothetical protein
MDGNESLMLGSPVIPQAIATAVLTSLTIVEVDALTTMRGPTVETSDAGGTTTTW